MPKPKRTKREQIERYKRKLQDLEKSAVNNKRRRRFSSSDESYVSEQGENHLLIQNQSLNSSIIDGDQLQMDEIGYESVLETQEDEQMPAGTSSQPILECTETSTTQPAAPLVPAAPPVAPLVPAAPPVAPLVPNPPLSAPPNAHAVSAEPVSDQPAPPVAEPTLDPTLLAALGESTSDTPEFGASIHDSLANIWQPLLRKGMTKDSKDKLFKEYLVPNNCKLLQAPKLNAEISAAVSELVRGRDKKYVTVQQQLGQGISAVNRAMDVLLKTDNKIEALKYLSDACRILSDLHYFFTKDRTKLITPSLDKNFLHVIQDAERDESLFGNTLSEKIKASQAIQRQGQQIKKSVSAPKAAPNTTSNRAPTSQGNWSGPPRYSSSRGGRGGTRKQNPSPSTRRPYINTTAATRPPPAQSKSRASAQQ